VVPDHFIRFVKRGCWSEAGCSRFRLLAQSYFNETVLPKYHSESGAAKVPYPAGAIGLSLVAMWPLLGRFTLEVAVSATVARR